MKNCFKISLSVVVKVCCCIALIFTVKSIVFAIQAEERTIAEKQQKAEQLGNQWIDDSIRQSIDLFRESAENWKSVKQLQKAAFCLRESAKLSRILSDYKSSLADLKQAQLIDEKINDLDGKIITLSLFSLVLRQSGNNNESENLYKQALELNKLTKNDTALAYSFMSAGMYNFYNGDVKKSVEYFEKSYAFASTTFDGNLISESLLYLGYSKARFDSPLSAFEQMKMAIDFCRKTGNQRCLAQSYFGIGYLHSLMDEKQSALDYFKHAENLFPEDFEWLERAKLYSNISTLYEDLGEIGLAEKYYEKAFSFYEKANYLYGQLAVLPNLAKIKYLSGNKTESLNLYSKGLVIAEKLNDKFYLAYLKEGLGDLNMTFEKYDEAIENYNQSLKVYEDLKIKLPNIKLSLGKANEKKGELSVAEQFYISALNENRQIKSNQSVSECLYRLSKLSKTQGKMERSLEQITESLQITEFLYEDVNNGSLKTSFFSNVFDRYEFFINLLMNLRKQTDDSSYVVKALQATEKSRARSMLENLNLSEVDLTQDADETTIKRQKEIRILLNNKADILTDLLSQNAATSETDKISNEINELETELENIKSQIKQQSPLYSAIKNPAPFDVGEFQREILDENSVLLEFSFGEEESYLWLVGKDSVDAYVLPPRSELENHIEKLRELLASRIMKKDEKLEDFQMRIAESESNYQKESKILSGQLFGQIADKIGNKRLIIVPDGKLHYFPVSALPVPNSDSDEPFLLTNETVYAPSAQTLLLLEKSKRQIANSAKNLLIFSDPVFTADDARFSAENKPSEDSEADTVKKESFRFVESLNSLPRLTASKNESDSILEIIGAGNTDSFSGFGANREQLLKTKIEDYKIIHFATHGQTDEKRPELSGIVLSRFDEKGQKLDEFFRIHDIYGLNLNADLVVLSACETGIGKEVKGEGLMSLNNAFLQSGAKSVMASLWKVEDNATLELMKNFYSGMADENLTPPQSLRQAQIKLRQNSQFKSPFYWAAFTVQGDFKNVPKISRSFDKRLYLLLFIPLFPIGFYLFRKRRKFASKTSE